MSLPTRQSVSLPTFATLRGWTIPLRRLISGRPGRFDHTYVTSDLGDLWGCAGRSQGGQEICRGRADIGLVRCIAGTDGRAGIQYGLTGVCHQIANRILHPANMLKVDRARGYAFSVSVFGEYGVGPWPLFTECYGVDASMSWYPRIRDDEDLKSGLEFSPQRDAEARFTERSTMTDAELDGRVQSLKKMLLGHAEAAVSAEVAQLVVQRHDVFWTFQQHLVDALAAGTIDRGQYLAMFNDELSILMDADKTILGEQAYSAIFGLEPEDSDGLIDADVFLASDADDRADVEFHP